MELKHANCTGDICLAGVLENNRIAKELRQSLFFEHCSRPIWTHLKVFHLFPRERFQLGPNSKAAPEELISIPYWNRSMQSRGHARPIRTRNVTVPIATGPMETLAWYQSLSSYIQLHIIRAAERIWSHRGQKRKMRLPASEASRKFSVIGNQLRKNAAGLLYKAPGPLSIGCVEAPWTLRPWGSCSLPPLIGSAYYFTHLLRD